MSLYKAVWSDGSSELIEADSMPDAREQAKELYDEAKLRRVVALDSEDEDEMDEEPEPDDEDDEGENPDEDDTEPDDE